MRGQLTETARDCMNFGPSALFAASTSSATAAIIEMVKQEWGF